MAIINEFGYQHYFQGQLELTDSERKMLAIRWDVADIVYDQEKTIVFKRLEEMGLDLSERSMDRDLFPPGRNMMEVVQRFTDHILGLLQVRAQADVAVVIVAHPNEKSKYTCHIKARQHSEYLRLLVTLRTTIVDWLRERSTSLPAWDASRCAEIYMGPLKAAFEKAHGNVPNPDTRVFSSIKRLVNQGGKLPMNITITGDGNVIGDTNRVVAVVNKELEAIHSRELAEAFALLKGTVLELEGVTEKTKRRTVRAIEDAEDEMSDRTTEPPAIEDALKRVKTILEESGQVFDKAEGWGARLTKLARTIVKIIPFEWNWFSTII